MVSDKLTLLRQFSEEDELFGDIEGIDYHDGETLKINKFSFPLLALSPLFAITGQSPNMRSINGKRITRETLSEYSEENETDLTSEFSDQEFEWDGFNKNQSIYQQMNQRLIATKVAKQREAEREQRELMQKRHKDYDPNQTLRLKDFNKLTNENLTLLDQLDDEKTVNYEYVRDDVEDFAQGFDKDFETKLRIQPSMPTLRSNVPTLKKYKSYGEFKCDNRVKQKLDRIPSFYNKNQLLSKFKETKSYHPHHKKMGTVRCLNNNSEVPVTYPSISNMKLNKEKNRWEGNDIDLIRFEKPSLITHKENKTKKRQGNMVYDEQNLRWINTESEHDVFDDIPDLAVKQLQSPVRGLSQFTQRTTSTTATTTAPSKNNETQHLDFEISRKLVDKFQKEQAKIEKKINHWFIDTTSEFNTDHYWEIRKMIIEE